ncbi:hypothetical protein V8C43DRAFT_270107 [Trichoderma afarasin]
MVSQHMGLCRILLVVSLCFAFFCDLLEFSFYLEYPQPVASRRLSVQQETTSLQASSVKSRLCRFRNRLFPISFVSLTYARKHRFCVLTQLAEGKG